MMDLYTRTCQECSRLITERYSTSFSAGIRAFDPKFRMPIYAVYGFVRFADEIVDTFYSHPQAELLATFREDTWRAIEKGISLNPVLHAFQSVVHRFGIERSLIEAFLDSMEMDLHQDRHGQKSYDEYIFGSAEVVGLMCLRVFCEGDDARFRALMSPARSLGAAFQKINFLRDMKSDFEERGRVYFPGVDFRNFTAEDKFRIEKDIKQDFEAGYAGVLLLPAGARFGVYLAYVYYLSLFKKIRNTPPAKVLESRIRVPDGEKVLLLFKSSLKMKLNLL